MGKYNKLWVALGVGAAATVRSYTGVDLGLSETGLTTGFSALTALLVYFTPNKRY